MELIEHTTFGQWVKHARTKRGWTQDMFAERVGCATATVRKIEAGERRPSHQMAVRIADILAVPAAQHAAFLAAARAATEQSDEPITPHAVVPADPSVPQRLPTYFTPLVGRSALLVDVLRILAAQDFRLVTLTGPGGIGKTRLAVAAASQIPTGDQTVFVALAGVLDCAGVIPAIAGALDVKLNANADQTAQLIDSIRTHQVLLVLDNLEHLVQAGLSPLLATLLQQVPGLRILATSRERLRLSAEWVIEVTGLELPGPAAGVDLARIEAGRLFLDRAQQSRHDFAAQATDAEAIAHICRMLGGNPLAIELAASWVHTLTPPEIADEITQSLDFLTQEDHDRPREHHSIRAVFDRSWAMLSTAEQRVLAALALFRGGFTRNAAHAVAGATLPQLAALVAKSLLRQAAPGRYEVHELLRQFALEALTSGAFGNLAETQMRHLHVFCALAEAAAPALESADQLTHLSQLDAEHENIRAALTFALDPAQSNPAVRAAGARLSTALMTFWFIRGHHREGQTWVERALVDAPFDQQPQLMSTRSFFALLRDNLVVARAAAEQAIMLAQQVGNQRTEGRAWHYLGLVAGTQGKTDENWRAQTNAARLANAAQDGFGLALARVELGCCALLDHDLDAAERFFTQGAAYYAEVGEKNQLAAPIRRLGHVAFLRQEYDTARDHFQHSLRLNVEVGDQRGTAACLLALACVSTATNQLPIAARFLGTADRLLAAVADTLLHADQDDFSRWINVLRQHCADSHLADDYAAGQRLTLPQVLALATEQ